MTCIFSNGKKKSSFLFLNGSALISSLELVLHPKLNIQLKNDQRWLRSIYFQARNLKKICNCNRNLFWQNHPSTVGRDGCVCVLKFSHISENEDWSSLFLTKNVQKKWRDSLFLTKHIIFSDFTVVMWCQLGLLLYRILQVQCDEYLISTKGQQLFQSLLILPVTRQAIKNAYFHSLSVI